MTITNRTFSQGLLVVIRLTGLLFLAAIIVLPGLGPTYAESQADVQMVQPEPEAPAVSHNTWTTGASLPTARMGAAAGTIGPNIYVIGGYNVSSDLGVNEIYNPKKNTWSTGSPDPNPQRICLVCGGE